MYSKMHPLPPIKNAVGLSQSRLGNWGLKWKKMAKKNSSGGLWVNMMEHSCKLSHTASFASRRRSWSFRTRTYIWPDNSPVLIPLENLCKELTSAFRMRPTKHPGYQYMRNCWLPWKMLAPPHPPHLIREIRVNADIYNFINQMSHLKGIAPSLSIFLNPKHWIFTHFNIRIFFGFL